MSTLSPDITETGMRKLFEKYGKAGDLFIHENKGFGFIRLGTRAPAEAATWSWATCHSAESSCVCVCLPQRGPYSPKPQYVSDELLEEACFFRKRHCCILGEASGSESSEQMW